MKCKWRVLIRLIWKWLRGPPHDTHKKQKSKIVKENWDIPTDILPINFPQPTWLAIQVDLIVAVNVISLFSCLFCIYQKKACHFAVWGTRTQIREMSVVLHNTDANRHHGSFLLITKPPPKSKCLSAREFKTQASYCIYISLFFSFFFWVESAFLSQFLALSEMSLYKIQLPTTLLQSKKKKKIRGFKVDRIIGISHNFLLKLTSTKYIIP